MSRQPTTDTHRWKCWGATEDLQLEPLLAQWLDEQVGEAVTDYVTKGVLDIDGAEVWFAAADPMDHLIVRGDLKELVREYLSCDLDKTGKLVEPEYVADVQRLRAALVAAIELIDKALP